MSSIAQMFQNMVHDKKGNFVDLTTHCKDKKIGLLFSGYWCQPCREMTPEIIKYYEKNEGGKDIEIIYVNVDVNETAFRTYYGKMPWLALDYNQQEIGDYLKNLFDIKELPQLVILDGNSGKVLIKDATRMYNEDLVNLQKLGLEKFAKSASKLKKSSAK